MPNRNGLDDTSILESALIGLQHQHSQVETKISEIRRTLGIRTPRAASVAAPQVVSLTKRTMSRSARQKIAAAQKKRWAAYKKEKAQSVETLRAAPRKKRRMSAAGKNRIIEASKKRWAEYRAKKASAA